MLTKFRHERSLHGYSLDELKSGLQKYIRRSNEAGALFCASELDRFAEVEGGERIRTNFIHRLMVIYLEDIGPANYKLWPYMIRWCNALLVGRKLPERSRTIEIQIIRNIVVNLCKSYKTRATSQLQCVHTLSSVQQLHTSVFGIDDIPSEYDEVKFRQCLTTRDWRSVVYVKLFLKKETKIAPLETILKQYLNDEIMEKGFTWKKELGKEKDLIFVLPLCVYLYGSLSQPVQEVFDDSWDDIIPMNKLDDWVYDKHVKVKRDNVPKSTEYFALTSAVVDPEVFIIPRYFKYIYTWLRCSEGVGPIVEFNITRESEMNIIMRAQLTCSHVRPDTYFIERPIRYGGSSTWFVKGPYIEADEFIRFQQIKKKEGLPYVHAFVLNLYPDRWEKVPVGVRNTISTTKKAPFLICVSLYDVSELQPTIKNSKLWPDTQVNQQTTKLEDFTQVQWIDYLQLLDFRLRYNIGDFADRNFIAKFGRVYSVDEQENKVSEVLQGPDSLLRVLKKNKYELVKKMYKTYAHKLNTPTLAAALV